MKKLSFGKVSFLGLMVVAVTLGVVAWMALASGPAEPAEQVVFEQDGIISTAPAGVVTSGGELQKP